jgi:lauroyl/myristoyl acyltransferase
VSPRAIARVFVDLTGQLFRLLPRRWRFETARRLALAFAPLLRRTSYYARRNSLIDGHREEALRIVLRCMIRRGVPFDPAMTVHGGELVPHGSAFLLTAHFLLNHIMISRWLHDRGERIAWFVAGPREPLFYGGTRVPLEVLQRGTAALLQVRRRLNEGQKVLAGFEEANPREDSVPVETAAGLRHVTPGLERLARRLNVPVLFAATHFDETGRVAVTFARPSHDVVAEFCDFLRTHAAAIRR